MSRMFPPGQNSNVHEVAGAAAVADAVGVGLEGADDVQNPIYRSRRTCLPFLASLHSAQAIHILYALAYTWYFADSASATASVAAD